MDSSSNVKEVKEKGETTTATVDVDVDAPSSLPARPRIWKQTSDHVSLPKDTGDIIKEAASPLADIPDAMGRPYVQNSLNSKVLEVAAWDLMQTITTENDYNQNMRRFLSILLGDNPETAHLELIDRHSSQETAMHDQLLQLVQESLSRSDEFMYRISESRDRVAFAIEQKTQLRRQLEKAAAAAAAAADSDN